MLSKIEINSKNLIKNLNFIKKNAKNRQICAMVKANAYGHGLKEVVSILSGKVAAFGVVNIDEALEVRKIDKTTPVIIFGACERIATALKSNISLSIISVENLEKIIKMSKKLKKKPLLHLNINTGMNRFGIKTEQEFLQVMQLLRENNLQLQGIFTHFSNLTTDKNFTANQKKIFDKFLHLLPKDCRPTVHVGGGNSIFQLDGYDMYRAGLFLYGYGHEKLKHVLTIKSKIVTIQNVKKGEKVGYLSSYTAQKDMRVGVVPIGYADGIKRGLSNRFDVKIGGKTYENVGNICMDCFMVDLKNSQTKVGDEVVVMDNATDFAQKLNTTEYEILTNFNAFRGKKVII